MTTYRGPELLGENHDISGFTCGRESLDDWLQRFALLNQRASMTRTHVVTRGDTTEVVGFYSLATGGVLHEEAPSRVTKGVARHPVPVIVLARLAVHVEHQGAGLGQDMLQAALLQVATAADTVGVRALLVHAKDAEAKAYYMRYANFEPSPIDPMQLMLLMKDLRLAMGQ